MMMDVDYYENVMKHNHELESGRTSCISYNIININEKLFNFVDVSRS